MASRAEAAIALAEHVVETRKRNPSGGHHPLVLAYIDAGVREDDTSQPPSFRQVRETLCALRDAARRRAPSAEQRGMIAAYDRAIFLLRDPA